MIKLLKKDDLGPRFHTYPLLGPHGFIRIAYTEWGPRESEHTVLCVHGLTRNGRDFDFLARHLAQRGIRVVAPDLPGRGRSERLPHAHHYATATYLSAMTGLLCRLNVSEVDWVGTSLGGHIGMELAALSGAPIRRLVLNDFGARLQGAALNRLGRYSRLSKRFGSVDELEQHLRTIYQPFGALTDEQWRHMTEHSAVRDGDGVYSQNYDPAISTDFMLWPAMLDIALWHVWERVECPVLILRGETSDLLLPSTVEKMKQRGIAASRRLVESVEIPDCGHAPSLMHLEQIRVVEEFVVRDQAGAEAKRA
jgi:pimeloyl-ACP methyl ester carboxylesterase